MITDGWIERDDEMVRMIGDAVVARICRSPKMGQWAWQVRAPSGYVSSGYGVTRLYAMAEANSEMIRLSAIR